LSNIRGGKGLHGPDKQQDALRDVRSGAYDKGGPSKAPHRSEAQRTEHQCAQSGADVRQGVPDADTVPTEESDLPEGCLAREWAPWTRTPDEVTSRRTRERHFGRRGGARSNVAEVPEQRPAPQVGSP
jgi:hypothetical protein